MKHPRTLVHDMISKGSMSDEEVMNKAIKLRIQAKQRLGTGLTPSEKFFRKQHNELVNMEYIKDDPAPNCRRGGQ